MSLPSPQYIRSVIVNNQSPRNYNIYFQIDDQNSFGKQFNICGYTFQKYEFTYEKNGAVFVTPITLVNIHTNTCCGEQSEKYILQASQLSSVVNVAINIDYCGNVSAIVN